MKLIHQIQQRYPLLGVTATVSVFAAFIVASRFAYVFYLGDNDVKGPFMDFPWLSTFLYTCGVEFSFLSFSLILAYATRFMEYPARKPFMMLSYCIAYVAFFFTSWILLDENRWNFVQEIFFSLGGATLSVGIIYFFSRFIKNRYEFLERTIRNLFSFIYTETESEGYIKEELKEKYARRRIELVDEVLDNE